MGLQGGRTQRLQWLLRIDAESIAGKSRRAAAEDHAGRFHLGGDALFITGKDQLLSMI